MAEEIINTTWPDAIRFDSSIDESDITSGDTLGSIENIPKKSPHQWRLREWFTEWFLRTKNVDSLERGLEFMSQPITYPEEEYLQGGQIFFKLCEPYNKGYYFDKVFIHKVSDAVVWTTTYKKQERVPVSVTPEVVAESEANGWTDELETAIELAKMTYTSLKKIDLLIEKDPEIQDRETLRFILTISGTPDQVLAEEDEFKRGLEASINPQTREIMTVTYHWG
jgi:hypothetical protein